MRPVICNLKGEIKLKGCIGKKIISSILSLVFCTTVIPMASLNSSAADPIKPKIAAGQDHTVVLKSDGSVWAVGNNEDGKLGVGKTVKELSRTATFMQCMDNTGAKIKNAFDIACSDYHTAVLRGSGELWQCGYNPYGQLGIGEINSEVGKPTFVHSKDSNNKVIMNATAVSCNQHITAIIRENGELWMCGYNANGQLGTGETKSAETETVSKFKRSQDNRGVISDAKAVSCGKTFTSVIRKNGELWQCGGNSFGQLGTGDEKEVHKFVPSQDDRGVISDAKIVSCGSSHTAVIRGDGELWQCGYNEYGQLGIGESGNNAPNDKFVQSIDYNNDVIINAKSVSCYGWYTVVIRGSDELWVCGYNEYGQLGIGESGSDAPNPRFVQSRDSNNNAIADVKAVAPGWHHLSILRPNDNENFELYSVGENNNGQLGLGKDSKDAYKDQVNFIKSTVASIGKDPNWNRLSVINPSPSHSVKGVGEFQGTISVTIEWGALTYDYNVKWSPSTKTWVQNGDIPFWKASTDDADKITVTNNSSEAYNVVLFFQASDDYDASDKAITGTFIKKSSSGEEEVTNNTLKLTTTSKENTVYLKLSGMPDKALDKAISAGGQLTNQTFGVVTAALEVG